MIYLFVYTISKSGPGLAIPSGDVVEKHTAKRGKTTSGVNIPLLVVSECIDDIVETSNGQITRPMIVTGFLIRGIRIRSAD